MTDKLTGESPAFPGPNGDSTSEFDRGITVRDYLAAKAMNGYIACPKDGPGKATEDEAILHMACWSYKVADAMLAVRNKGI